MKLVGKTLRGGTSFDLAADTKRVARYTLGAAANVVKLSVYADGRGSGVGDQVMRGVIYSVAGNLLAQTREVLVRDGQAADWIDLPLDVLLALTAAPYDFGVLGGVNANSIRVFGDVLAGAGHTNADSYADGAAAVFGSGATVNFDLSIFGTYATHWVTPVRPDEEIARLPWDAAQQAFAGGSVPPTPARLGWYGNAFDEDGVGSFVLAQDGGQFAGLVGERVALSVGGRVVYAFCKGTAALNRDEDMAVPRRVYSALSLPCTVPIQVEVAVVS